MLTRRFASDLSRGLFLAQRSRTSRIHGAHLPKTHRTDTHARLKSGAGLTGSGAPSSGAPRFFTLPVASSAVLAS